MAEVLSLSTIVEKHTINIESRLHPKGCSYDLLGLEDLGILEQYELTMKYASTVGAFGGGKKPTPQAVRAVTKAYRDIVKVVVPALEPSVLRALKDGALMRIVAAWSTLNLTEPVPVDPPKPLTGAA